MKIDKVLRIVQRNSNGLQNYKEEIKLSLNQNFIVTLLIAKHVLQQKITLAYQGTNYNTPIILMAERMEVLRYFSKEQSITMNCKL